MSAELEELAREVDAAAAAVTGLDDGARQTAQRLRSAIEAAHRTALVTIVRRLRADPAGREVLFELVDDPLVRMVFSLHGIIRSGPEPAPTPAPTATSAPSPSSRRPAPVLIPLSALNRPEGPPARADAAPGAGWVRTSAEDDVPENALTQMRLVAASGTAQDVVVVRIGGRISAFRDECAHQALPLGGALLDVSAGTLTCPWHGYCYDALSGECLSAPGAALRQLPLRVIDGYLWIKVGA